MKVVLVSPTAQMSGAEIVLLRAAEAMNRQGWEVMVLSPTGSLSERVIALGMSHQPIADLKLPPGPRPLAAALLGVRNVITSLRLRRWVHDADVLVVNGFFGLPALRLSRNRTPVVWLVHDVIYRASWRRILRITGKAVSLAVAVSEAVALPLRPLGLRVVVVPNGTPWPVAPVASRPEGPPVVGCAAMLTSWKGQDVLLDAVARLSRKDLVVELAGGHFPKDGPYVARLRDRAARPDLVGRVKFLGPLSDPIARMRTWTVAVLASVDPEASPLALLEAMSLGVPIVASDHGGPREMVGGAGLLVRARDSQDLASGIDRLVSDEDLWERCHEAGPGRVEARYVLATQIDRLIGEIEAVAVHAATKKR